MRTNFFKAIQNLSEAGSWYIDVSFTTEDRMIVTVFSERELGIENLPLAIFIGTAEEINEAFFNTLSSNSIHRNSLFVKLEPHQNQTLKDICKPVTFPVPTSGELNVLKKHY
jgi:hypothetical protein